eukprot:3764772-Rhodomonas_salina.1
MQRATLLLVLLLPAIVLGDLPACNVDTIDFTTGNGQLLANGEEFLIKGASWFGFEEVTHTLHGLWWDGIAIADGLDLLKNNGFNAVRLPFAVDAVLSNPSPADSELIMEPNLQGKTMLEIMMRVVELAANRQMLVMLDNHRLRAGGNPPIHELWYDPTTSVEDVKQAWSILAQTFCSNWNVFAADIKNCLLYTSPSPRDRG